MCVVLDKVISKCLSHSIEDSGRDQGCQLICFGLLSENKTFCLFAGRFNERHKRKSHQKHLIANVKLYEKARRTLIFNDW